MKRLPYVSAGYEVPSEQPVIPGKPADYIGIYVIDEEPRIVVELTSEFLKFGKIERWSPTFECAFPFPIEPQKEKKERFFQITFTGTPGKKEDFRRTALCDRRVVVTAITKMFEGEQSPMVR
jgi:hypothetical protein